MPLFRCWSSLGLLLAAGVLATTAGCYESHPGTFAPGEGPPDAGDAGEVVTEGDAGPDPFYPMCTVDDPSVCPPVDVAGNRGTYGYTSPDGCIEACQCRNVCEEASDCPIPRTGDSVPECIGESCALPCSDEDVVCPDGMECVTNGSRGVRFCMWARETTPGCSG